MALFDHSATELHRGYRGREFSPAEVADAVLGRIGEWETRIGAFRQVLAESAQRVAAQATDEITRGELRGPLHGVPVTVKELLDVEGASGCYGSLVMRGRVSHRDAEVVRRLRAAGAIVIGTTRSHEFGWGITTQHERLGGTRNPWDPDRVPGGSSGGSGAALAAGLAPLSIGTDTGGSIRIPASYCGVVGFKPSFGCISRHGLVPVATSLDHIGPMARTVADIVTLLPILAGHDPRDPVTRGAGLPGLPDPAQSDSDLGGFRLGTVPGLHAPALAPDHEQIFRSAVEAAVDAGAAVAEIPFDGLDMIRDVFATVQLAEAYFTHSVQLGTYPSRAEDYGSDVRMRLEAASHVTVAEYLQARAEVGRIEERFAALFEQVDAILTPVAAGPPSRVAGPDVVRHLDQDLSFRDLVMGYTVPQNLTGLPACVIPAGMDALGLPVGVQITGPRGRDDFPLRVASALEARLGPLRRSAPRFP